MMKKTELIKKAMRRFTSALLAAAMLPGALAPGTVFAEEATSTEETVLPTESSTVDPNAPVTLDPDATEATTEKVKETTEPLKSDDQWKDAGVIAETQPAAETPSIEAFSQQATSGGKAMTNMYTLTVSTGIRAGDTVEYFAIRYKDNLGNPQTKYIFPEISYTESMKYVQSGGNKHKIHVTGYIESDSNRAGVIWHEQDFEEGEDYQSVFKTISSVEDIYYTADDQMTARHERLGNMGYAVNEPAISAKAAE